MKTGLGRYGVHERTVVRQPARSRGLVVCSECGTVVAGTRGTQHLTGSVIVDSTPGVQAALADDNRLPTLGWRCRQHTSPVVIPESVSKGAPQYPGWTTVKVYYADDAVRYAPVPEKEVDP